MNLYEDSGLRGITLMQEDKYYMISPCGAPRIVRFTEVERSYQGLRRGEDGELVFNGYKVSV